MKGPTGKAFDGIYSNSRFIHSAASLVGSVVNIQVKNGSIYEGVFRTFSQKVDFVLEMVHKVEGQKPGQFGSLISDINPKDVTEKMIFSFQDVVMLSVTNIDLEYAAQDSFTDTAISKFNGQVQERELEPWDGGNTASETATELGETDGDVTNGWDADEMFRTNEEKYGVKSSFNSNLLDYTIPLKKQNTEEYKIQEAKASKIAQEIESGCHYKNRLELENGDEEDRFSAVVRPDNPVNTNNNSRFSVHRGKKTQVSRPARSSPSPTTHSSNRVTHPSTNYHKMSSPNAMNNNTQTKMTNVKPLSTSVHSQSPKPVTSPSPRQPSTSPSQISNTPVEFPPPSNRSANQNPTPSAATENRKLNNGEALRITKDSLNKETTDMDTPHKTADRGKEVPDKKPASKKPYEEVASLKKFGEKFKLESKDSKETRKETVNKKTESKTPDSEIKSPLEQKTKEDKDSDSASIPDSNIPPDVSKTSSLNPNAKEFIFNPNAKSFTPRTIPMPTNVLPPPALPPVQPPPRLHTQSPVIPVPQHTLVPGMPHPMFTNMTPHYVLPATPVSMPVGTPYTPATTMAQQAPRFRKTALPVTLPRNDSSQSIHVQAATGQPILAPPPAPQFTIQYPSIIQSSGPPQPHIATYAQNSFQMYQMVGPRMLAAPQPLSMVPAPGPYAESPHVPTQIFVNPQAVTGVQHPSAPTGGTGPSANSGQHSASSTPQSQTPSLHPAPSPVHQQPPPQGPQHGQPPTPTGHPGNPPTPQVIYHSQLTAQHPLHINPASAGHAHPYQVYNVPQPMFMIPPQPAPHPHHPSTFQALPNHYHHPQSAGPHAGTPNQILQHPPVQIMPTSTAMGHGQVPVSNSPYVPHSQGEISPPMLKIRHLTLNFDQWRGVRSSPDAAMTTKK